MGGRKGSLNICKGQIWLQGYPIMNYSSKSYACWVILNTLTVEGKPYAVLKRADGWLEENEIEEDDGYIFVSKKELADKSNGWTYSHKSLKQGERLEESQLPLLERCNK